jgi:hypothetical protein
LSENLANAFGQGTPVRDQSGQLLWREKTWRVDDDGRRFYDFLQPFLAAMPAINSHHIGVWLHHARTQIARGLAVNIADQDTQQKYLWLARYFNGVAAEYPDADIPPIEVPS